MSTNQKSSVLIVDDEEMVITSVRAYLEIESEFEVHGFTSPEEAAKYLEENLVDIAVSDYLMPRMSGIQFLHRARELQPEASRVLLTGHADKQSAIGHDESLRRFFPRRRGSSRTAGLSPTPITS